ncbi:MAG: ThiF family adenylyltransferase [Paludibacteraceae bacterium]|nr:ThiF family adenylyltransferase [Paludibacteraceae bacterium]
MKALNIKHIPNVRIALPDSLISPHKKYVGPLMGYYVENTHYYNILPCDTETVCTNHQRFGDVFNTMGYIVSKNPFSFLGSNIDKRIHYINAKKEQNLTMAERFKQSRENKSNSWNPDPSLSKPEFKAKLQSIWDEVPEDYWNCFFEILSGYKLNDNYVIGYWENNKLHIIQLDSLIECKQELYALKLDVFSRNTGILESSIMLKKKALFIGCGSVGSLVAVELAKAGVGSFMLVDNDIFGYHNICRHQCGIYDVGRYKTDALADRILQINPYAVVHKYNCTIQEVDRDELLSFCDEDCIAIGGADNREGDLYANDIAKKTNMPFISIGCWERAFAGEIFYCLPDGMPDYEDFLVAMGYTSGRVTQNRMFYTTEEDLEKVSFEPGISADVNFVVIIGVKIILDLLNRNTPNYTQRLIPYLTQYTLVCNTNDTKIGGEQAEIFTYPLQVTTSIIVPYRKK